MLKKYKDTKHPLEYKSIYQILVMVILSARDSDRHINSLAPKLFEAFPDMATLSKATPELLTQYIGPVVNSANKSNWLIELAQQVKTNANIPLTKETLSALKGIGSKSANVILREAGKPAEGVMVDLHTVSCCTKIKHCKKAPIQKK